MEGVWHPSSGSAVQVAVKVIHRSSLNFSDTNSDQLSLNSTSSHSLDGFHRNHVTSVSTKSHSVSTPLGRFLKEISISQSLLHPDIVRFYGVSLDLDSVKLVSPLH
ncbi:unnamed protein product [Protopolystoma xenopodis]|uniref:Protein kinase domain-containing protein n=1 Tax=Protopolystoma xenopodis TaxID=117903 RepID=A0A3S5AL51_9PLAT|nr:unnamed protein product [Protopolystoma xenopodis]